MTKVELMKLVKKYTTKAEKMPAKMPVLLEAMEKEDTRLFYFDDIKSLINTGANYKQVKSLIAKGLKTSRRHRDDSRGQGLSVIVPAIMAQMQLYASKDLENAAIELALNDGIDLVAEFKQVMAA